MPAFVMSEGGKYRVFHGSGVGSARLLIEDGKPVDGGGFHSRIDAVKLAKLFNAGPKKVPEEEATEES